MDGDPYTVFLPGLHSRDLHQSIFQIICTRGGLKWLAFFLHQCYRISIDFNSFLWPIVLFPLFACLRENLSLLRGLLKVLAGVDTNFTVTSKAGDDEKFSELWAFKWTRLLIPPTTLLIINLIGVVVGISNAINNGYESWGPLFGKLFFAFWVIVHLYPFLKGLLVDPKPFAWTGVCRIPNLQCISGAT
ncbi:hypothetical protein Patl1_35608 [Pistacia atlantica]|nr:hypothetical protein Patl1_35608 [Pistacia atlantica]